MFFSKQTSKLSFSSVRISAKKLTSSCVQFLAFFFEVLEDMLHLFQRFRQEETHETDRSKFYFYFYAWRTIPYVINVPECTYSTSPGIGVSRKFRVDKYNLSDLLLVNFYFKKNQEYTMLNTGRPFWELNLQNTLTSIVKKYVDNNNCCFRYFQ